MAPGSAKCLDNVDAKVHYVTVKSLRDNYTHSRGFRLTKQLVTRVSVTGNAGNYITILHAI